MTLNPRGVFVPGTAAEVHADTRARATMLEQQYDLNPKTPRHCIVGVCNYCWGGSVTGQWTNPWAALKLEKLTIILANDNTGVGLTLAFAVTISLKKDPGSPVTLATASIAPGQSYAAVSPFIEDIPPNTPIWFTLDAPVHTGPTGLCTVQAWFHGDSDTGGALLFDGGSP